MNNICCIQDFDIWNVIIIPIAVSIVASFIWWLIGQLYSISARKNISSQIIALRNDNECFIKALEYNDYHSALVQAQLLLDRIYSIYSEIKPCIYCCKKRKLINTLLCNIHHAISKFFTFYEGWDKPSESVACCEKLLKILRLPDYADANTGAAKTYDSNLFKSTSCIELLYELNNSKKCCRKILKNADCFNGNIDIAARKKHFCELILVDVFYGSCSVDVSKKFFLTTKTFSRIKYEKLIESIG